MESSCIWKAVLASMEVICSGLSWKVGNGKRFRIGLDPWLGSSHSHILPRDLVDSLEQNNFRFLSQVGDERSSTIICQGWNRAIFWVYQLLTATNGGGMCQPFRGLISVSAILWTPWFGINPRMENTTLKLVTQLFVLSCLPGISIGGGREFGKFIAQLRTSFYGGIYWKIKHRLGITFKSVHLRLWDVVLYARKTWKRVYTYFLSVPWLRLFGRKLSLCFTCRQNGGAYPWMRHSPVSGIRRIQKVIV